MGNLPILIGIPAMPIFLQSPTYIGVVLAHFQMKTMGLVVLVPTIPSPDMPPELTTNRCDSPAQWFFRRQICSKASTHKDAPQSGLDAAVLRLQRFDFFAECPQAMLETLAGAMRIQTFHAGELLWGEGRPADSVLFIEHGMAKLVRLVRDGVFRTYALFGPGDSLGLHTDSNGHRPADALALNNGMTGLWLPARQLHDELARHPRQAQALLMEADRYVRACMDKIDIVSSGEVPQRIAQLMRQLIRRYGHPGLEGSVVLPFRLTLEQVGEIVDARQETIARILSRWQRQNWFSMNRYSCRFTNTKVLDALVDGAGSRGRRR